MLAPWGPSSISAVAELVCYIRTLFQDLGPHTIVILYNPEPTIPGASYGPSHTCYFQNAMGVSSDLNTLELRNEI